MAHDQVNIQFPGKIPLFTYKPQCKPHIHFYLFIYQNLIDKIFTNQTLVIQRKVREKNKLFIDKYLFIYFQKPHS